MKTKLLGTLVFVSLLGMAPARAATLISTGGDVSGINGLTVNGVTYDVTFLPGTSYDTAYSSTAPTFLGSQSAATDASNLIATLLNNNAVMTVDGEYAVIVPYAYYLGSGNLYYFNGINTLSDASNPPTWQPDLSPGGLVTQNYSTAFTVFAPTPVPPALPLFASALGALALLGWLRKKKAAPLTA